MAVPPSSPVTASHSGSGEPLEDGGPQQERPDVRRPGAPGPPRPGSRRCSGRRRRSAPMKPATSSRPCMDSAASWRAAIQPSVRPSSADTSLGASVQAHRLVQVGGRLIGREAQVGGADLDELAARSEAGEGQRGVGAGRDHQVELRRQVVEQERHPGLDLRVVDHVVVIEHQHDVIGRGAQAVEQRGQGGLDGRRRCVEQRADRVGDARCRLLEPGDDIGPERCGVVVAGVERDPRGGSPGFGAARQPVGEQRGLPEARRRGDERQPRPCPAIQQLGQARTRDHAGAAAGGMELGREQRAGHDASLTGLDHERGAAAIDDEDGTMPRGSRLIVSAAATVAATDWDADATRPRSSRECR